MDQNSNLIEHKKAFRFAHLADLHLGSWRSTSMRELSTKAFDLAIKRCIDEQYDFIIFAGDIFNTSLPAIDIINHVASKLQELKNSNIPLYVIPGSHDFSPTGRSMIDVLESAGLLINVCKGQVNPETKLLELKQTIDPKTGAKITGILGRRGLLDRTYYENLEREKLENSDGYKIFMFHTTLTELKPKHLEMLDSQAASFLPKHQNYYAGGHIHHKNKIDFPEFGPMTYTGALFPNNFSELEKYSFGGFYEVSVQTKKTNTQNENNTNNNIHNNNIHNNSNIHNKYEEVNKLNFQSTIVWHPLKIIDHLAIQINCTNKSIEEIQSICKEKLENNQVKDTIITLRLSGNIGEYSIKDIDTEKLQVYAKSQGAKILLINTNKIERNMFKESSLGLQDSPELMEEAIINEHLSTQNKNSNLEKEVIQKLLQELATNKQEGEKSYDFSLRVIDSCKTILNKFEN